MGYSSRLLAMVVSGAGVRNVVRWLSGHGHQASQMPGVNNCHTTSATTTANQPAANSSARVSASSSTNSQPIFVNYAGGQPLNQPQAIFQLSSSSVLPYVLPNLIGAKLYDEVVANLKLTAEVAYMSQWQTGSKYDIQRDNQLEAIKQIVGCEHGLTWHRPMDSFGWRFVHDQQDSFDLLPQDNPTEEVTAWLNAVCQQDNLELWLVGVPQVAECPEDWTE